MLWELASNLLADAELVDPRKFAAADIAKTLKKFQKALKSVIRLTEELKEFEKPGLKYPRVGEVDQQELLETVIEGLRVGWWAMQTSYNLDRLLARALKTKPATPSPLRRERRVRRGPVR